MTQDTSPVQQGGAPSGAPFSSAPTQIPNVTPAGPHTVPAPSGFTPVYNYGSTMNPSAPQYGLPISPVPIGGSQVDPRMLIPTTASQNLDGSLNTAARVAQLQAELQALTGAPQSLHTAPQPLSQGSTTPTPQTPPVEAQKGLPATLGGFSTKDATPEMQEALKAIRSAIPGVNVERALGHALKTGDPSLVDLEYLQEKSPQNAALVAQMARSLVTQVNQAAEALTREVYQSVGGEAQWQATVTAFNNSASKSLRAAVATMLDSSSPDQVRAGAEIVRNFVQQNGMLPQTQQHNPLYPASPALQELSEDGFQQGLNDLRQMFPEGSPQFNQGKQELMNRRLAALQRQFGGGVPGLTR